MKKPEVLTLQLRHESRPLQLGQIAEVSRPGNDNNLNIGIACFEKDMILEFPKRRDSLRFGVFILLLIELCHSHGLPSGKKMNAIRDLGKYFQAYVVFEETALPETVYPKVDLVWRFPTMLLNLRDQELSINPAQVVEILPIGASSVSLRTSCSPNGRQVVFRTRHDAKCFIAYVRLLMEVWNPTIPPNFDQVNEITELGEYLAPYLRKPDDASLLKKVRRDGKKGITAELVNDHPVRYI